MYLLPAQVVPGDVIFLEPGDTAPTPCDLLRFLNVRSQGILLFYSEKTDAEESGDLADVGLPPNAQANGVRFNLDGGVRSDAFMYTPGFQDPGYFMLPGATASTAYNVIGILPEPLSSLPFLLAFLLCLRRLP